MSLRAPSHLRAAAVVCIGLLVSATCALTTEAAGASEPPTTYCSYAQPLTAPVTGNLVVPAGEGCELDYDVAGNAVVETGAELYGDESVAGNLRLGRDASVVFGLHNGVGGYLVLDHAAGVSMFDGTVGGSLVGSLDTGGSLFFRGTHVLGRLAISGTGPGALVGAEDLRVVGDTVLDGVQATLFDGVTLGGRLVLRHVHNGRPVYSPDGVQFTASVVCGGRVRGNVVVENSTGKVDIGAGAVCIAQRYRLHTEGSFLAHDNTASVFVGGEVGGNAVCRDNLHHPRGDGTTTGFTALQVDGRRSGQCSRLPRP